MERPKLRWIIQDFLPKPGIVALLGAPKAGKSFLALQLALDIANGRNFLGSRTTKSSVLYLQFDTSEFVWRDRLVKMSSSGVSLTGDVYMVHPDCNPYHMHITTPEHKTWIRDVLAACNPDVVVVDVLREVHDGDENESTAMKLVGDTIRELFAGRALILLHHTPKLPANEPVRVVNASRGSSYISGMVDALWLLHDGFLTVESRFCDSIRVRAVRGRNGLWTFPDVR